MLRYTGSALEAHYAQNTQLTQEGNDNSVGWRIRALRGDRTQEEFAKAVGITRSALANYETGRTKPSRLVIMKIANATGTSPTSISKGEAQSFEEYSVLLGATKNVEGTNDLTQDEKAIIKVLRACDNKTAIEVAATIVNAASDGRIERSALDLLTFERDFVILSAIKDGRKPFQRGFTKDTLGNIMAHLGDVIRSKKGSDE